MLPWVFSMSDFRERSDDWTAGVQHPEMKDHFRAGSTAWIHADAQQQWNNQYSSSSSSSVSSGSGGPAFIAMEAIGIGILTGYVLWSSSALVALIIGFAAVKAYVYFIRLLPRGPWYEVFTYATTVLWFYLGIQIVNLFCWSFSVQASTTPYLVVGTLLAVGNFFEKKCS